MRLNPVNAAVIGATLICWSCATLAESLPDNGRTVFGHATIGHLQPRATEFLPGSAAEQAEQNRESDFDAKQKKLDVEFDKKLNICRWGTERPVER
jgi:hypothetical protein